MFSRLPPANITIVCAADNGFTFDVYGDDENEVADRLDDDVRIIGYVILGSSLFWLFGRMRWMGNAMFFSLQFMFISMAIVDDFNPMMASLGQLKAVTGYN